MSTKAPSGQRLEFVDGMRGLAVLFMFVLHTAHGWLWPGAKQTGGWQWITGFGGMAAPLFFFLAGASVGLQWRAGSASTTPWSRVARGLSLIVLGYALRVQMWVIDGGAMWQPWKWPAAGALIAGYVVAYLGCERLADGRPGVARWLGAAALLVSGGLWGVERVEPAKVEGLLRVDVLQGIGGALVLLHLVTSRASTARARVALAVALAAAVALGTEAARAALPGGLPEPLAGYVARWATPAGQRPVAMFPLMPWTAYTGVGAALGVHWADGQAKGTLVRRVAALALLGVALSASTRETWAPVYALMESVPALVQPARVAYRLGVCMALSAVAMLLCHRRSPLRRPLTLMGSASLVLYWVHLEFAFGAAATPIRRRLDYASWWAGLVVLTVAMAGVAWSWRRFKRRRRAAKAGR